MLYIHKPGVNLFFLRLGIPAGRPMALAKGQKFLPGFISQSLSPFQAFPVPSSGFLQQALEGFPEGTERMIRRTRRGFPDRGKFGLISGHFFIHFVDGANETPALLRQPGSFGNVSRRQGLIQILADRNKGLQGLDLLSQEDSEIRMVGQGLVLPS
jgi:hypothetical protein